MNPLGWSIVIPTFRRPRAVEAAVRACLDLTAPPGGFEVVVVDDGGGGVPDGLGSADRPVRIVRQQNAGPAAARNTGSRHARGRCLAFLDDDCCPERGWLVALDRALSATPEAIVGGRTINALVHNTWSAASQDLVDALYLQANRSGDGPRFFTSNNIAVTASSFCAQGGFDESFVGAGGEDRAFCHAWRQSGRLLVDAPDAVVLHHHTMDARGFWRQHFGYGRGAHRFYDSVDDGDVRGRGPLAAVRLALAIVTQPMHSQHRGRRFRRSLALVAAQIATAAGRLAEARTGR